MRNGINVAGLSEFAHEVRDDVAEGRIDYGVGLVWEHGTRTTARTSTMQLGHHRIARSFTFGIDEPRQLTGLDSAATPQEYLLGGLAGCMAVGYAMGASMMGITLDTLEIDVAGSLDLRGFMDLEEDRPVGFESLEYTVRIGGDGTPEQFASLHEQVARRSPNRATIAQPVRLESVLEIVTRTPNEAEARADLDRAREGMFTHASRTAQQPDSSL